MKVKKIACGCLAFLGLTTVLLGCGRYLYVREIMPLLGKQLTPLAGAEIIPENATAVAYLDTDYEKWSQLKQFDLSNIPETLQEEIKDWQDNFSYIKDLEYQKDIEPWLGGAMFAVLPGQPTQNNNQLLMILGIKDKFEAKNFFDKLKKESEVKLTKIEYQEIEIATAIDQYNKRIVSASIDNQLIIANNPQVIKQAIESYRKNLSLINHHKSKSILNKKFDSNNSLAAIYLFDYNQLLYRNLDSNRELPLINNLETIEATVINLTRTSKGLKLRLTTQLKQEVPVKLAINQSELLQLFPDNTIALINGQNLDKIWSTAVTQLETNREASYLLDIARLSLHLTANLELDRDIFGWMDGEFALGLIKTETPITSDINIGLGGMIVLETTRPKIAQKKIANLEKVLATQFDLEIFEEKINDKTIVQWRDRYGDNLISYSWLDFHHLFLALGNSAWKSIDIKPYQSLTKDKYFKSINKELTGNNLGYCYLDLAQILNLAYYFPIEELDVDIQSAIALLKSIEGIGIVVTMPNSYTYQQDLFILFKEDRATYPS